MQSTIEVNNIVEGSVVNIKPFGAIVKLGDDSKGLVHISHISNKFVHDINDHVSVGDVIKVKVLSVDKKTGRIALTMKESLLNGSPDSNERPRQQQRGNSPKDEPANFEDKLKNWMKVSNERHAELNKRSKRR